MRDTAALAELDWYPEQHGWANEGSAFRARFAGAFPILKQVLAIKTLCEEDIFLPLRSCDPVDTALPPLCWRHVIEGFEDRVAEPSASGHSIKVREGGRRGLA